MKNLAKFSPKKMELPKLWNASKEIRKINKLVHKVNLFSFTFSKVVELGIGMFRNYGRNSFVQKEMVESNFIPYLVTKAFEFVDSPKVLVVFHFFPFYSRVVLQSLQLFQVTKMSKK
jgi:hypothetical protein